MLVVSAYMDINSRTLETNNLSNVLDFANERELGLIIGIATVLCLDNNLTIENIGHSPTYKSRGTKTCIDVTLTKGLRQTIQNWEVDRG